MLPIRIGVNFLAQGAPTSLLVTQKAVILANLSLKCHLGMGNWELRIGDWEWEMISTQANNP